MNKVILMSIQPKWLVKILNGEKTIEIRKSIPKCELPIDVYLYCTKGKSLLRLPTGNKEWFLEAPYGWVVDKKTGFNGRVVAKFTLNKVEDCCDMSATELELKSKLSIAEICDYIKAKEVDPKMVYAWHIKRLEIFNKPKDLWDFHTRHDMLFLGRAMVRKVFQFESVYKAPRSWQYVWEKEQENEKDNLYVVR